jgi:hypothetical protein
VTAAIDRKSEVAMCPQCGAAGEFGYRNMQGGMVWYCAAHRLAQFWADAQIPAPLANHSRGAPTDDGTYQQNHLAAAQPAGRSLSNPMDALAWHPPGAGVDGQLVFRPAGRRVRPAPVVLDRTPRFDEAGHFIHPCCKCGRDGGFGIGVNLRAGQLGTWFCGRCKPLTSGAAP